MTCRVTTALLTFCAVGSIAFGGCGGGSHPGYSSPSPSEIYAYSYPDPWAHIYDSRLRHPRSPDHFSEEIVTAVDRAGHHFRTALSCVPGLAYGP